MRRGRGLQVNTMKNPMRAAMLRILILLLLVCAGTFAWETSRNAGMQAVTGQVVGTVYKGYRISYQLQGQSYQFDRRFGIADRFAGVGPLRQGDAIPVLVDSQQRHAELINTTSGRYGMTMTFVSLLALFAFGALLSALRKKPAVPNK